jgi:tetratricopeptide (TPR) repeat protein
MKCVILALLSLTCASIGATDYAARLQQLQARGPSAEAETLIDQWLKSEPNDPDAWIAAANYYNQKASDVDVSSQAPQDGGIAVTDPKTGKVVGSISSSQDSRLEAKAIGYLQEAAKRFPDRMDIWCGLSYALQESGAFDRQLEILKQCVAYATGHPAQLRWLKGGPLPSPAELFVPEKLHDYTCYYLNKQTPADNENAFKIAELAAANYPDHPYALNDLAALYTYKGNIEEARNYLEKAHKVAPTDTLVLLNLGDACAKLNDPKSARGYYEQVAHLKESSPDDVAQAKAALQQLNDSPR